MQAKHKHTSTQARVRKGGSNLVAYSRGRILYIKRNAERRAGRANGYSKVQYIDKLERKRPKKRHRPQQKAVDV